MYAHASVYTATSGEISHCLKTFLTLNWLKFQGCEEYAEHQKSEHQQSEHHSGET